MSHFIGCECFLGKKDYLLDPWIKLILLLFKARKITYNQSVARTELRTMEEAQLIQVTEALKHISTETNQKYLHAIDRIKNGAERYIDF